MARRRRQLSILDPQSSSSDLDHVLRDCSGQERGRYIKLPQVTLDALTRGYRSENVQKLSGVSGFPNIKNIRYDNTGLIDLKGSCDDWQEAQDAITCCIHENLCDMKYCQPKQGILLYLSYLKAVRSMAQGSHVDYKWKDILPQTNEDFTTEAYKNRVPFIGFTALTEDGTYIEVWPHIDHRELQKQEVDRRKRQQEPVKKKKKKTTLANNLQEFEQTMCKIIESLPKSVADMFGRIVYAKWGKQWFPALVMNPFSVPPDARRGWIQCYEQVRVYRTILSLAF
jgi:hypothetical protein